MTQNTAFEELAARAHRIELAVDNIRGTATSPNGDARITTTVHGDILDLTISCAAGLLPDELAHIIVNTHRHAHDNAKSEAQPIRAELTHDPAVARAVDIFASTADQLQRQAPQHIECPDNDDDAYYANASFLEGSLQPRRR